MTHDPLLVTGHVPRPQSLCMDDLRRLPSRTLGTTEIACLTGRHVALVDSYRGVSLIDVLGLSGLPEVARQELKECMIVARGSDGYRALFSWNELYNTPVGNGVLVVFERNLKSLDEHLGAYALISASDLRVGPRHLRHLREVKVLRITDA